MRTAMAIFNLLDDDDWCKSFSGRRCRRFTCSSWSSIWWCVCRVSVSFGFLVSDVYLPRMPSKISPKDGLLWWLITDRAASMTKGMG